ncbi:MAG: tyrosine--tRNA ligase [Planctomycetales bacterium]|nr:tyrosine--tRNA ligase [Planctomycetales bacterium]
MKDIYQELEWRGLICQATDSDHLQPWLMEGSRTVYCGFDPTADSLHVGSLVPLMYLRRFQQFGHRPIALVGGATGMIGDPSGKSKERNLLSEEALRANVAGMEKQMRAFLDFDGPNAAQLVNNYDWMSEFSFLEFLRVIGKNAPVNVMLAKDSVKNRLETGLSYTEFSYMLLQAYDFVHLFRSFDCRLQIGGSDQWGNVTAGIDLARRMDSVQLYGMTCPLLTKSDGTKMGKTEDGTVWLDPTRTSPYAFYQYWIGVDDGDVGNCLRMLTDLNREEIESLDAARQQNPEEKASQRRLAESLTELVHGKTGLEAARNATKTLFAGGPLAQMDESQLAEISADVPSLELSRAELEAGISLIDALRLSGLVESNSVGRRTIQEGGAYVNNHRESDIKRTLTPADLLGDSMILLRRGKKKYALLRFAS